ncbi:Serine/threonine-protein kinase PrkC [Aquisphaera giovannonii]|uniref:Serine/threonine-protein kinase PrkC n=1 Tax=Aquisphaera giovannonii TaxID=406548 RepID=A0A5B9VXN5_9BACT|nr:protein kinase [Aquisphaera giovannonii]QEH32641.1 Serine/threonine-protein kinase PrkC [Aquisphaera giovannonii]
MLIVCPSCRHAIRLVDVHPGRFMPKCPRCRSTFRMTIPDEPGKSPVVQALEPSAFAEPVANLPEPPGPPLEAAGPLPVAPPEPPEVPEIAWPEVPGPSASPLRLAPLAPGIPRLLGGYLLLRLLGRGPRGPAALAQPLAVAPPEVLKLTDEGRRADRTFRALWAREAFAASFLDHPNLVSVRGIDSARGRDFAAMEWAPGRSVAELIAERGRLDPWLATVLTLQAARGLRAGHAQGLVHRDVKPENLRIDGHGLLKVDDLGLEMTPSLASAIEEDRRRASPADRPATKAPGKTTARPGAAYDVVHPPDEPPPTAAAGSPAYMAPEQAADPLRADGRADVYALGGTFYAMVTGRPPFPGENAVELIRRHREDRLIPPSEFAPGLPRPIGDAIAAMLGKRLEERYPSMAVVVEALEGILGLRGERAPNAAAERDELAEAVRQASPAFGSTAETRLRNKVAAMAAGILLLFVLVLTALGVGSAAAGIGELGAITAILAAVASARLHGSTWPRRAAEVLAGGRRAWIVVPLVGLAALSVVWSHGLFGSSFLIAIAGGMAAAFHVYLDRPAAAGRREALERVRTALVRLRGRGHDEALLRELVAREAGRGGRGLVDRLFGFEARRRVRDRRIERHRGRHRRLLERCEEGRLEAAGLNLLTARRRARREAKAMVLAAAAWHAEREALRASGATAAADAPSLMDRIEWAAADPEPVLEPHEPARSALARRVEGLAALVLGGLPRFVAGMGLAGLLAAWLDARGIVTLNQVRDQVVEIGHAVTRAVRYANVEALRDISWSIRPGWSRFLECPDWPWIPEPFRGRVPAMNVAAAAAMLLFSLFFERRIVAFAAILGAGLALAGPAWGLEIGPLGGLVAGPSQACLGGLLLMVLGVLWPRRKAAPE